MVGTISPDVARAAVALRRSHPHVAPLDVLDVVMRQRTGRLADFGSATDPATPFGDILAEAFDRGMTAGEWHQVINPAADPALVAAQQTVWRTYVRPRFASRYGLTA